tara:strand:- start:1383 stop:2243 length:861 start_codon:yes stop_codon:yes gene_type:complete
MGSPLKQTEYWYKINGKPCTKAEYNAYKNKPGSDEPGKSTNDPDASGNKAKIAKNRANNEASKRPTVLTEAQTKLKDQGTKLPEKKPPFNYKKTPLDFSSPLKGKKRRERRELREAKYGTKSRRKARKIEGTTRREQKKLEKSDMKVAKKREAKSIERYKTFTDAELMARKEQGSSYKTDSEKTARATKEKELRDRVANRGGLNYKKTPLDFKSPIKQSIQDSTTRPNIRTDIKISRKLTEKEKEIQAANKAIQNSSKKKSIVYDKNKVRLNALAKKNPIATLFTS